ncbi:hypothetical protein E4U47_001382 [Claviceps purpurea]|nr:hypothetical protein E4U47_001382 [Claviceps purpurea]
MKFSSVLGTFALATLEAYRAYASPLEDMSPVARTLAPNSLCCVRVAGGNTYGVPIDESETTTQFFITKEKCKITVNKEGDCKSWPVTTSCPQGIKAPAVTLFVGPSC